MKPPFVLLAGAWFALASSSSGAVTPQQAVAVAVNDLRAVSSGVALSHPGYEARWTRRAFEIDARTGPSWGWTLDEVRLGADRVALSRDVAPVADEERRVDYHRGAIVERYVCKASSIEQQFVIPQQLAPGGGDLLIAGTVRSSGAFEPAGDHWLWRDARGAIAVGDVTVFDASGRTLPASMTVTAERIEIAVDGAALAGAVYPVTVDPFIGPNDFRISNMGTEGDSSHSAGLASVAYNSQKREFLVVWKGYEGTEVEIWGQRISAATGEEVGGDFKISDMGGGTGFDYQADSPDVTYNAIDNQYFVVWSGDDNAAPLIDGDMEIFGEILDWEGVTVADDFRISFMGDDAETDSTADRPAVAWDSVNNRYLVVWAGYDSDINNLETEVFGRVLSNVGVSISGDDTRLSNVGDDADSTRAAQNPDVAFDGATQRYMVVWSGDHHGDNAYDIYGQRVDAGGTEVGSDFRISDLGDSDSDSVYQGETPAVAANGDGEFLVVWFGDDDTPGSGQLEIWGQRVDSDGAELGTNDFRISDMGPAADSNFGARNPAVAYWGTVDTYIVAWEADDSTDEEIEIWMRRVDGAGTIIDADDVRVSDMGPDASSSFFGSLPAIAFGDGVALIAWHGDDDTPPLVDNEHEVFGQLYAIGAPLASPVLDDFSVDQATLDIDAADLAEDPQVNTKNSYIPLGTTDPSIFTGDRNLRISSIDVSGGPPTVGVAGGLFSWDRPGSSTSSVYVFWDGQSDVEAERTNFSATRTPYDLTGGGAYDRFVIDVSYSSSTSLQMLLIVWTNGSNFSQKTFTLPTNGPREILFTEFTPVNAGAAFDAARVVYLTTYLNSGTWEADISSIRVAAEIGPPSGDTTTIDASPGSIAADGSSTSEVTVQARDASDAAIPTGGATVLLSTTLGSLGSVTDNGDGTYTATLTSEATLGTATISGSIDGNPITDSAVVELTPGAASVAQSTISASPPSIPADDSATSTITVELRDANGFALADGGDAVLLSTTLGSLGSVTDNLDGTYSATLTGEATLGTATISGTIDGNPITDTAEVELTPGPPSLALSTISAAPPTIVADGSTTSTITVELRDQNGFALTDGGDPVALDTTLGSLGVVTDNLDGTYTATLTSETTVGTATISGTIDGNPITDTAEVELTAGPPSPALSTISASPTSIVADGSATSTITVVLRDENGLALTDGGDAVALDTTSGGLGAVTDNGDGTYSATLTAPTTTGTAVVTGTVDAVAIQDDASVIFTVGPAATLLVEAPASATGGTAFDVTVTARDAQGRTATSYTGTVAFSSTATSASLPSNYTFTGGDGGVHTFSVTLSSVGNRVVTVTDTVTSSITGNDTVAVKGSTTTALSSSANPSLAGQSVTFTATVTSAIAGTVTGTVTFKDGAATIGTGPVSGGTATFTTTTLGSGSHSITAEYGGSSNFHGSTSAAVDQTVNVSAFGAPALLVATATSTTQVSVVWTAVEGATSYELWRSSLGAAFAPATTTSATSFTDTGRSADTTYVYQVRAIGLPGTSAFSASDAATTTVFTNASLAGVSAKALHITELRTAVAAMRTAANLTAASFTGALTAGSTEIQRIHVIELRTALDEARDTLGLPAVDYTDPTITAESTKIKAAHVEELRAGTQ